MTTTITITNITTTITMTTITITMVGCRAQASKPPSLQGQAQDFKPLWVILSLVYSWTSMSTILDGRLSTCLEFFQHFRTWFYLNKFFRSVWRHLYIFLFMCVVFDVSDQSIKRSINQPINRSIDPIDGGLGRSIGQFVDPLTNLPLIDRSTWHVEKIPFKSILIFIIIRGHNSMASMLQKLWLFLESNHRWECWSTILCHWLRCFFSIRLSLPDRIFLINL